MASVDEYEVVYGHSERMVKEPAKDYESAMKRLTQLTTERLPCRDQSSVEFPVGYVRVTNVLTGMSLVWRSKDSMEFTGVW